MIKYVSSTDYLQQLMDHSRRKETVKKTCSCLARFKKRCEFDLIVVRGLSGVLLAPEVASKMDLPFVVVRKGEQTHGHDFLEVPSLLNTLGKLRYVILDDFISSGNTMGEILCVMRMYLPLFEFVGMCAWYNEKCVGRDDFDVKSYPSSLYRMEMEKLVERRKHGYWMPEPKRSSLLDYP